MKIATTVLGLVLSAGILSAGILSAQDPVKTLPESYSLQFENEWVKVVRVRYAPHAKLPAHAHTDLAAAFVYLNDAGPVLFKHIDLPYGPAMRPETRAGSFRLYRGLKEVHEVENTSERPSEFLRVEFKTDPRDPKTLKGRFFRDPQAPGNLDKVQFENDQIRITRLVRAPGQSLRIATTSAQPALLVALTAGRVQPGGSLEVGQERWFGLNTSQALENTGAEPIEFLRFDFKTPPLAAESTQANGRRNQE